MSVVVAVKVSEGLVLGADSASVLAGSVSSPQGEQEGIIKIFQNARKVFQIGDFPIGALTWGQAYIGSRTVESLVRQWEHDNNWSSRALLSRTSSEPVSVRNCADSLRQFLASVHENEYGKLPVEQRPQLGLLVAGYSDSSFFPELWRFVLPQDSTTGVHNQRPDIEGQPDFGASWFGQTDAIVRLHFGHDDQVPEVLSQKLGLDVQTLREALLPFQYQVPFPVMPLQDAIEYTNYLLNVVIGRYRFVLGPELCGGQVEIAAITEGEFSWICRKSWELRGR